MKNKDLQQLLSTFPPDLDVVEPGIRSLAPVYDVSERRDAKGRPYLVLETAPIPSEKAKQTSFQGETNNVRVRAGETK